MRFSRTVEELIADLRNLPGPEGNAQERSPKGFGDLVEWVVERHEIGKHTLEERILAEWPQIVGPAFAKRCQPVRIDPSGTLLLEAGNATVRRELIFMEDRILTALGSLEGGDRIHRVALLAARG